MSNMRTNGEFSVGNARFALYLLLFCAGVVGLWLGFHPKSPMRPYDDYYVLFPETGTLRQGSVVQIQGIKKGYVESIDLRNDGVIAHAKVLSGTAIPRDSKFRVINVGLLGEREIEIRLGTSPEIYAEGDSTRGAYDLGSTRLMYMGNTLLKSADSLLTTSLQVWDSTLGNPEVQARLARTGQGAMRSIQTLSTSAGHVRDSLVLLQGQLQGLKTQIATLQSEAGPDLKATVSNAKDVGLSLVALKNHLDSLVQDANWISQQIRQGDGTAGLVLQDAAFHARVKSALDRVKGLMSGIQKKGLDLNVDIF